MLPHLHSKNERISQEIQNKLLAHEKGNRIHHIVPDRPR
jgi:hypothetical protein